ncbi:MAG TPA: ATP-binding protein, partial [Candidatus Eremiobacteraceae bacterium]|nr:ATP-binding protein [Candidatus Eremiobacteraceae bacterium]
DIGSAESLLHRAATELVKDPAIAEPALTVQRAVMGSEKPTDDAVLLLVQLAPQAVAATRDELEFRKTWIFHSSDAYSAHASRHELMKFVRRFLSSDEQLFRIELIIGEILANTVEHAPGLVNVDIDWSGRHPVMTIVDSGPGLKRFASSLPQDKLTEDGRGLFLIGTLAQNVRVESTPGAGTKMTVTLAVNRDGAVLPRMRSSA